MEAGDVVEAESTQHGEEVVRSGPVLASPAKSKGLQRIASFEGHRSFAFLGPSDPYLVDGYS